MELVRQTADISSTEGANQCGVVSVLLNETTPQTLEGNDWSSLSPPSIQSGGKSLRSNAGRRSCLIRNSSASVSVNHEFLGDVDATVTPAEQVVGGPETPPAGVARKLSDSLDSTWVSYGLGAQFDTSKNLSFYGVLERSSGSDYAEDFKYSVGMPLDVILTFATPSTFHGVAKHAIFAGVQRQRRSAPAEQGAQHL